MPKQIYNWKRFWCPRGASINLSGGGYLYDPDSEWGRVYTPNVFSFDSIAQTPCLILLGEPGIGKSFALNAVIEATKIRSKQEGNEVLFLDLRSYGSEDRFARSLFENSIFVHWTQGNHHLYVFLDSLDEGLLRISVLPGLLIEELKKIDKQLIPRLRLRIACRPNWPLSLEDGLQKLWGEDAVRAYELVSLRQKDVIEAARVNNFDPHAFLSAIDQAEAVPLAIKPITLEFLINLYRKSQSFRKTRTELYLEGCRHLCEEKNQSRQEARLTGDFSAEQRLIVASRIAAITIFTNRYAVWNDVDRGDVPNEDVTVSDLVGGKEKAQGNEFEVSEKAVKETLGTGLFSARGANRLGWAHQTYAEFLAAYYLSQSGMSQSQMLSLIAHPNDQEGKLVPQLHETGAWLAAMEPTVFQEVIKTDPEVLLRSDVTTVSENDRANLVGSLLKKCEAEQPLLLHDWSEYRYFKKLAHPNLAEQLRPYICDSTKNSLARDVAIEIIKKCKLQSLENDLVRVALDPTQLLQIRQDAASAVARMGTNEAKAKLKPLATGEIEDDLNDELKGSALQALWPAHLTAEELFGILTPLKHENFYGNYQAFLLNNLTPHLQPIDFPMALRWVERKQAALRIADSFQSLSNALMLRAWERLDVPEVREAFARVTLLRLEAHEGIFCHRPDPQSEKVLQSNETRRRQLLATILEMLCETGKEIDILFYGNSHLVLETDIPWMIECLQSTLSEKIQQAWAQTIERCFNWSDRSQSNAILTACQEIPILAEVFAWFLNPVELGSPEAERMKAAYLERQRRENRTQEKSLLNPPPAQRVVTLLDAFERGSLDAWWQLNIAMTLRPNGTHSHRDFEPDLATLPGWEDADSVTRKRILEAAKKYIVAQKPEVHRWLESNTFHRPTFAGYKALRLLQQEKPDWLMPLTPDVWQKWAPTILAYPISGSAKRHSHRELVKMAYAHASAQIIETLVALIDKENREHKNVDILDEVKDCWDDRLADALLKKSQDEQLQPKALGCLLCSLLDHNAEGTKALVEMYISARTSLDEVQRVKAVIAASALLTTPMMLVGQSFGQSFKQMAHLVKKRSQQQCMISGRKPYPLLK